MFPVPRLAAQLEQEWAEEIAKYLDCSVEVFRANPTRLMKYPPGTLRLELMDGSKVEFQWAFHIIGESKKAIGVFTEHCGHHLYPFHEVRVFRDGKLVFEQEHA